jgi:chromosome segregation ATPase
MNELKELESGIEQLKRDSQTKKAVIAALESEKAELLKRSEELSERLNQTNESHRESYRRLTGLVNSQVTQLKMELAELSNALKGLSGLEQRLESQEKGHEKTLKKLEKELALVEKSLSDVERVKSELSHQRTFFEEAKLQLEKSLQAGIAYVRKELEAGRREDAKATLKEFKQELQRIASLEEGLRENDKRLGRLAEELSALQPVSEQVALLRDKIEENLHMNRSLADRAVSSSDFERTARSTSKRMEELENRLFALDKRLSTDKNRLEKTIIDVLNEEKVMEGTQENIKKWFDAKHHDLEKRLSSGLDALTTQMEEGAALVDNIRARSQKLDLMTREVPKRLEEHSREITRLADAKGGLAASLESLSGDIKTISGRLSSSLERIASLEKGLSSTDKGKEARLDRLAKELADYQEVLGSLSTKLSSSIERITGLEKGLSSVDKGKEGKIDGLERDLSAYQENVGKISTTLSSSLERIASLEKGLSSTDKSKESRLDKLSRDFASYQQELSDLSANLSSSSERIAGIEKTLSSTDKSKEARIDGLSSDLAAYDQELKNLSVLLREFSDSGKLDMANLRSELNSALKGMTKELDKRVTNAAESGLEELRERTRGLASVRDLESELKVLKSGMGQLARAKEFITEVNAIKAHLSALDSRTSAFAEGVAKELGEFRKSVDSRFSGLSDEQAVQFKKEFDYIAKNIDSIRDISSDIKIFRSKLSDMERFSKTMLSVQEFSQFREYIESKLSETDEIILKSLDKLARDLEGFKARVESDKLSHKDFSKSMELIEARIEDVAKLATSSTDDLRKDLDSLRKSVADRLGEVKGSQLKEFKDEIKRLSQLEKDMGTYARTHEERLDQLSEGLSSLQAMPPELGVLRERLDSLEKSSGSAVPEREFSKRLGEMKSAVEQLQRGFTGLDKRLHSQEADMDAAIQEALGEDRVIQKSQDAVNKLIDARMEGLDKRLSKLGEGSKDIGSLTERVASIMPNVKAISDSLSSSQERLAVLEKEVTSNGRSKETRIDELSKAVEAMDTKLDSSKDEIKEFREYVIEHVNDIINSYEKRFGELSKNLSGKQMGKLEKGLTELGHLKDKVSELDALTKGLSEKAVPDSEFVESIKAVSKRIDGIENLYSGIDKKASLHGAQLDRAVQKALSDDRLLQSSQKHIREWLESRITGIEKRLSEDMASQGSQLSEGLKELTSIKEGMARLKTISEHIDDETMSRVGESLGAFAKSRDRIERRLDALGGELRSMSERLVEEKGRTKTLEQRLKSSLDAQRAGLEEMLRQHKSEVGSEISDEAAKIMKDAELGEVKRKQEFENLLRKFQDLHAKTQQNLEAISRQRESFLDMGGKLKERIDKQGTAAQSKLSADYGMLKERLADSENLIMKLNNMISELQIRLEEKRDVKIDFEKSLREFTGELEERMKTNEEMFDSEMDAFKHRVDSLADRLSIWKDVQEKKLDELPVSVITKTASDMDNLKARLSELDALAESLSSKTVPHSEFAEKISAVSRGLGELAAGVDSMKKGFAEEKNRTAALEQRLKSSLDAQRAGLEDMLRRHKSEVGSEISDEAAKIMKDAELGRRQEFENLLRKFQDLHAKTQQNLDAITRERESLSGMESKLKAGKPDARSSALQSRLLADYDKLKQRLTDSESLIMKLNDMISGLQSRLESGGEVKAGLEKDLTGMKEEVSERMKTMDDLIREIAVWKDVQKKTFDEIPVTDRKQLEALNKSISGLESQLKSGKNEMKKFKEYVIEYINDLVNTYEKRMGTLKRDIDFKLSSTGKPRG